MTNSSGLLQATLSSAAEIPHLAEWLSVTLSLSGESDGFPKNLESILEQDARLRAYWETPGTSSASTVETIVARRGIRPTRNAALASTFAKFLEGSGMSASWIAKFREQEVGTAILSELIIASVDVCQSAWAFPFALLRRLGLIVLGVNLPEHFEAVVSHSENDDELLANTAEILGFTHLDLGSEILLEHGYPESIAKAVRLLPRFPASITQPWPLEILMLVSNTMTRSLCQKPADLDAAVKLASEFGIRNVAKLLPEFRLECDFYSSWWGDTKRESTPGVG